MISGTVNALGAQSGRIKMIKKLIKFCIVGFSSTAVDFGLFYLLHFVVGLPVIVSATLSFFVAVCNGFYWNRLWTFRAQEGDARRQYPKFVATNIIGWLLNISIMSGALILAGTLGWLHGKRTPTEVAWLIVSGQGKHSFSPAALYGAKIIATVLVTAWNFTASHFWTFKQE